MAVVASHHVRHRQAYVPHLTNDVMSQFECVFRDNDQSLLYDLCEQGYANVTLCVGDTDTETPLMRAARLKNARLCEPLIINDAQMFAFENGFIKNCAFESMFVTSQKRDIATNMRRQLDVLPFVTDLKRIVFEYVI